MPGLHGYPATLGGKAVKVGFISGLASYVNPTGQQLVDRTFRSLDFVAGSISLSGLYRVEAQPVTIGNSQAWYLRWIVISTGLEVANAVNLSAEQVNYVIIGS